MKKSVCDKLQREKNKKKCIRVAVWQNTDKYTARRISDRRLG